LTAVVRISTTAQSTAALVAIIGGFLVSRLIGLVSEKTQQAQLFDELKSERRVKDAELKKFNNTVVTGIQKLFREDYLDSILESKGNS
jgi:cell division protein FtsB